MCWDSSLEVRTFGDQRIGQTGGLTTLPARHYRLDEAHLVRPRVIPRHTWSSTTVAFFRTWRGLRFQIARSPRPESVLCILRKAREILDEPLNRV